MADWPDDRSVGVTAPIQTVIGQIPVSLGTSGTLVANGITNYIYTIPNDGYYYRLVAVYFILYTSLPAVVEIYYQQPTGGSNYYLYTEWCRKSCFYRSSPEEIVPLSYGDRYIMSMRNYDTLARTYKINLSLFKYLKE